MGAVSYLVPVLYVAALTWAVAGDFLRAQLGKDLEQTPPFSRALLRAASLPTLCLIGALFLRLLVHKEGLLLTALILATTLLTLKMFRVSLPRTAGAAGAVAVAEDLRRILSR